MCGDAVLSNNPVKPIHFRILGQCPECAHVALYFSNKAYYELFGQSASRLSVTWPIIPCYVDINEYLALVNLILTLNSNSQLDQLNGGSKFKSSILNIQLLQLKLKSTYHLLN